ncbi:MAG: response regulator transcription factor [Proteobacteria bacterium]|nr:response regulator transcription factor [Pseudomonadota bacterium]
MDKASSYETHVALAFGNILFSEGIKRLISEESNGTAIRPSIIDTGSSNPLQGIRAAKPEIILTDFTTLYNQLNLLPEQHGFKIILFDTNCGDSNIVHALVTKGIRGVIRADASPKHLIKALQLVKKGDIWLDKGTVKNLVTDMNPTKKRSEYLLTPKEKEVVILVSKGCSNREIAGKLFNSEATVKTHLYRIYRKLDIKNRSQLVTFILTHPESISTTTTA